MNKKNRVRWTTSVDPDLLEKLKALSNKTRIPTSKLADEALELLFVQHKVNAPAKARAKKTEA